MAVSRRHFLFGLGGAVVGLPFLEGLQPRVARADTPVVPPFALFYRRANGVQQALYNQIQNAEPERWWPSLVTINGGTPYDDAHTGRNVPMTETTMSAALPASPVDCALRALAGSVFGGSATDYTSKLTVIRNLRHVVEGSLGGHREGFIQGLTGCGVQYLHGDGSPNGPPCNANAGPPSQQCFYNTPYVDTFNCDPLGESLDNRIAAELGGDALYFGLASHSLGFVSWTRSGDSVSNRIGEENLVAMYQRIFLPLAQLQSDPGAAARILAEGKSVNDLVLSQIQTLRADPRLSKADQDRLDQHTTAIRDMEIAIVNNGCTINVPETDVQTYQTGYANDPDYYKGSTMVANAQIVAKLGALAIACGQSRSVLLSIGEPQDVAPYSAVSFANGRAPSGFDASVSDFHSLSHRLLNTPNPADSVPDSQQLHHDIDVFHLNLFKTILDQLATYTYGDGTTLLDKGVCVHYSDLGSGQHETYQLPYLYVGGAGGQLVTDAYVNANKAYTTNFLNTIGAAVGCKNASGGPLDDFNADTSMVTGRIESLVKA